jgi:beta-galactosidase
VHALPAEAAGQPLCARVTNEQGVDVPFAKAEWTGPNELTVTACGDGEMYVRVTAANGAEHARIISVLELTAEGFGVMNLDPYRFIAGALYSDAVGEITPGNEQGVSFSREGFSAVGFSPVDFGPVGSDELTLPVFALNDDRYEITLWDGRPLADGRVIAVLPYQKKSVWNVYQEETYRLPEVLTGVHSLYFSMNSKAHLKGFSFTRQSRVGRYIRAVDAESLYGDSFRRDPDAVRGIGNNVTLGFEHFVFPRAGKMHLMLEGSTPLAVNPVAVRFSQADGSESTSLCPFVRAERTERQIFSVTVPQGESSVSFIFLPGSRFDFDGFTFRIP